jgi:uncharacterized protein YPO0396
MDEFTGLVSMIKNLNFQTLSFILSIGLIYIFLKKIFKIISNFSNNYIETLKVLQEKDSNLLNEKNQLVGAITLFKDTMIAELRNIDKELVNIKQSITQLTTREDLAALNAKLSTIEYTLLNILSKIENGDK